MIEVLMLPDGRKDNPYQSLLADGLNQQGCRVRFFQQYRRVLPLNRASTGASVVHLHWLFPYLRQKTKFHYWLYGTKLLFDVWLLKARGVKVVWTIHNLVSHDARYLHLEKRFDSAVARMADAVILHSQAALAQVEEHWERRLGNAHVIAHGHYRGVYGQPLDKKEARRALGRPAPDRVFLYLGVIKPYKGLEALLEAWPRHVAQHPADQLWIAGRANKEQYAENLRQASIEHPSITLDLGFVPDDKLNLLFSAADFFVLPAQRILTSGSILLALSYWKPVIAPELPSIVETLQGADSLLYNGTKEGLLRSLAAAAAGSLQELEKQSRSVCERYDWARICAETARVYRSVLGDTTDEVDALTNRSL